ncbi:MAG: dihydroorotase [Lachnospiraceae bacterium]|nr:dihydroorotase [Lachnospiraceae bacterium]
MEANTILIKNAHILSPADGLDLTGDILIKDGRIEKTGENISAAEADESPTVIDAGRCFAAPGFVDVHCHFRDPGQTEKEDIHSGAAAAAAGGYTTVVCMANTVPAIDSPELLAENLKKAAPEAVHVLQCAAVTEQRKGLSLNDLSALKDAGAAGFTDDGSPIMNEALVREAMIKAAEVGAVLSFHEEDPSLIGTAGINEGMVSRKLKLSGAKREAEIRMIERDLSLALETGCMIDLQHVSAKESVELIRKAKKKDKRGLIHAEVTPNHFSLTEEAVLEYGALAKINPPLRTEEDRLALINGLSDGTLDLIATDHAPHTSSDKNKELKSCMSGIIGLETAFSLGLRNLVLPGYIDLKKLIMLMSVNPAAVYGLDAGHLKAGSPADIVIFSTEESTTFKSFRSRSDNTPFKGKTLPGRIIHTIAGGRKAY